jgi:tryptophan synthase alpha chain
VAALADGGASLIEIGIPFSDPIADGPTIQRASFEALKHHYSIEDYLAMVRDVRRRTGVPLIFMTYLNPILAYGIERLDEDGAGAGLDGLLVSDITAEEWGADSTIGSSLRQLKSVFLVAPTSPEERIRAAAEAATGFIYLVARTGVTGKHTELGASLPEMVERIRRYTRLPVGVGFGIRSKEDVRRVWSFAEGAIVGSAIVQFIEEHRDCADLPARVSGFVKKQLLP